MHEKAIVINRFWATVISGLLVFTIASGFGMAKGIYDAQADARTERRVIQEQIKPLQDANIPVRMTAIEQQMKHQTEALRDMKTQQAQDVGELKDQQNKMNDKLDRLLEKNEVRRVGR